MKTPGNIALVLGLIVTILFFVIAFIQSPTAQIARVLGQFVASAGIGIVIFLVSCAIGALVVKMRR